LEKCLSCLHILLKLLCKSSTPSFRCQQDVFLLTKIILPAHRNGCAGGARLRNLPPPDISNTVEMARKKATNQTELLTKLVGVRLSENVYARLEKFTQNTDCQTIGELARRILSKEKITYFQKDASMDGTMEELSRIRKELNSIGTNINQITHSFHTADVANQRTFLALKVAEQYNKVGDKVEQLLKIVSQLAIKWLQK
jgi:hypothetical protein